MSGRAKLSSNLLEMKFMKKSKEKTEREAEEEKRKFMFESELPDEIIRGGDLCVMEPSFVPCLQLTSGRFSFKGMNPEIEKLMAEKDMEDPEKLKRMDGISNTEMANRYSSLVGTMRNKFTTKRKRVANQEADDDDDEVEEIPPKSSSKNNSANKLKFRKPMD